MAPRSHGSKEVGPPYALELAASTRATSLVPSSRERRDRIERRGKKKIGGRERRTKDKVEIRGELPCSLGCVRRGRHPASHARRSCARWFVEEGEEHDGVVSHIGAWAAWKEE